MRAAAPALTLHRQYGAERIADILKIIVSAENTEPFVLRVSNTGPFIRTISLIHVASLGNIYLTPADTVGELFKVSIR
jgi:hypothetical protein